jgi:predicted ArsR family transcriptional regulator
MTSETKAEELLGTKQIAAKLKIDPKTVRKHLRAISGKASGERYAWEPTVSLGRNRRRQRQPLRHHRNRRHLQLRRRLRNHTLAFAFSLGSRRFAPQTLFRGLHAKSGG